MTTFLSGRVYNPNVQASNVDKFLPHELMSATKTRDIKTQQQLFNKLSLMRQEHRDAIETAGNVIHVDYISAGLTFLCYLLVFDILYHLGAAVYILFVQQKRPEIFIRHYKFFSRYLIKVNYVTLLLYLLNMIIFISLQNRTLAWPWRLIEMILAIPFCVSSMFLFRQYLAELSFHSKKFIEIEEARDSETLQKIQLLFDPNMLGSRETTAWIFLMDRAVLFLGAIIPSLVFDVEESLYFIAISVYTLIFFLCDMAKRRTTQNIFMPYLMLILSSAGVFMEHGVSHGNIVGEIYMPLVGIMFMIKLMYMYRSRDLTSSLREFQCGADESDEESEVEITSPGPFD